MEIIKEIIMEFHELGIPELIPRDVDLSNAKGLAKVIIGPRRAGKTYLLFEDHRLLDFREPELS